MHMDDVLHQLKELADPSRLNGMARYGIPVDRALGVSLPQIRSLAKEIGRDHPLAIALWATKVHEARMLATLVDEPDMVSESQMDAMVDEFASWDICDQCCNNLFRLTPIAWKKALEWSDLQGEFQKRAGFALMAALAVHDRRAKDDDFHTFLEAVERHSVDGRKYVMKALNWALRQIGKRNLVLNRKAVEAAERIMVKGDRASRWVASDALRELKSDAVRERLNNREKG